MSLKRSPWHEKVLSLVGEAIIECKKNKIRIADIGCDEGTVLVEIAKKFGTMVELYGIDYRKEAIKNASENAKKLNLKNVSYDYDYLFEKDFSNFPQYDIILFSEVYEHLLAEYQIKSLRIIGSLLMENGQLIMTVPNGHYIQSIERKKTFDQKYANDFFQNLRQTNHWLEPKKDEIQRILISLGYDIKKIGYFNWPLSGRIRIVDFISRRFEKYCNSFWPAKYFWKQIYIKAVKNPRSPILNKSSL